MENQCTVQVKLELGHRAQLRKKVTSEGFTHDWMVFVRGPESGDIQHFVDKVIFRLHESFPKPKRVCKEPPYKVEESGYAGFLMPIEVYFKNKEEPRRVCFNYDLFLNLEGNPPVNHLRCEKLTFNNPTCEFRRKLVKAGGVIVVPEGAEAVPRPGSDYPMLPTIPLSAFSDPKKTKPTHGSKEPSKESSTGGTKGPKLHKPPKEHRERQRKDSESRSSSKGEGDRDRDGGGSKPARDPSYSSSSTLSSKKSSEGKVKEDNKAPPKAAFKEPKLTLKEAKMEGMSPKGGGGAGGGGVGGGVPPEPKAPSKRPPTVESPKPSVKKQKKGSTGGSQTGPSPRVSSSTSSASSAAPPAYSEKKSTKEKGRWCKVKTEVPELKEPKKQPESDDSNSEDEASSKSEQSAASSPSNSSSSSDSSSDSDFEPSQKQGQGPLRSMVEDLQSEESDDDDSSSEEETPVKTNPPNRDSRLSLESESDSCDEPHPPSRGPESQLPSQKHTSSNNKVSLKKSPDRFCKPEKMLKKGYDKAYTEELVDLHRRLMALRERNILQQIVNLIEETGHFNVTNTTFDFDLFSLDESTVRKLQSYLEATAT
ncbi:protein ENL isoform X4 [Arapaima gigas]